MNRIEKIRKETLDNISDRHSDMQKLMNDITTDIMRDDDRSDIDERLKKTSEILGSLLD